jgi:hypothetical protein
VTLLVEEQLSSRDRERVQLEEAQRLQSVDLNIKSAFPTLANAGACRIVDMKYEPGARCQILYLVGDRLVLGILRWSGSDPDSPVSQEINSLGLHAYLFPNDPSISGLADTLRDGEMARAVAEALPECRAGVARVLRARTTLLRYRPGRRCTVRVDVRVMDGSSRAVETRILYAKLYHDVSKAASVYAEMKELQTTSSFRKSGCLVAGPIAFLPRLGLILQEPLEGTPLDLLLRRRSARPGEGSKEIVRAAHALVALHGADMVTHRTRPVERTLERLAGWAHLVETIDRDLGLEMGSVVGDLIGSLHQMDRRLTLVHGDSKPSQFLIHSSGVGILDFDHCGIADPASDVANFMATLRQHAVRNQLKTRATRVAPNRAAWLRSLEQHFLDAYVRRSLGDGGLADRANWYESVALLRKAYRCFQRSPRSPLPHALVRQARGCLEVEK